MQRAREKRGVDRARRRTLVALLAIGLALLVRAGHAQVAPSAATIRQAIDAGAYARADELATTWVAVVESQRSSDPLALPRAQDLLVEARVRSGKGAAGASLALAEQVLRTKEKLRGASDAETASSVQNLGLVRVARGELTQAIPLFERALTIRRASAGNDSPLVADTLDQLALVLIQLERF